MADAQDVRQETFLWLLRRLPHIQVKAELRALLFIVAAHLAIRARTKAGRRGQSNSALDSCPAKTMWDWEGALDILAYLPEDQREAASRRWLDGESIAEIAAVLHKPINTIRWLLAKARHTLRNKPSVRESLRA